MYVYIYKGCLKSLDSVNKTSYTLEKKHLFHHFRITKFPFALITDLTRSGIDRTKVRLSALILDQAAFRDFSSDANAQQP